MEPRVVLLEISRGLLRDFRGVFPYFRADVTRRRVPMRPLFHVRFLPRARARARVFFCALSPLCLCFSSVSLSLSLSVLFLFPFFF